MKKICIMLFVICLVFSSQFLTIQAQAPYITQSPNRFNEFVLTQDAYEPYLMIKTYGLGLTLNEPKDIYIDEHQYLYVLDSGNRSIVVFDADFSYVTHFKDLDLLIRPMGLFVRDFKIYVADYGTPEDTNSGRVHIINFDPISLSFTPLISHQRPQSPVLEINQFIYRPLNIAVDQNHTMYVVSEGSFHGVLMIDQTNRFLSFFAPNRVAGTLLDRIIQVLYGNNERAQLSKKIPPAPYNVFIDDSGYVFTITQTTLSSRFGDTIKKVNTGGINFFSDDMFAASDFQAVSVGNVENIYAITRSGFIYEYDREGNLLFMFAGRSQGLDRMGLFQGASGISVNQNSHIIVSDEVTHTLHIFKPTLFAHTVHQALGLYNQGKYVESQALWEDVLRYNALFDLAHKGIGLSYMMQGSFEEAMVQFEIANAKQEYSLAFWEVRNVFLITYAGPTLIALIGLYLAFLSIKRFQFYTVIEKPFISLKTRIKSKNLFQQLGALFYFIKNPADAIYEIKVRHKVSYKVGLLYVFGLLILYTFHLLFTGLLFSQVVLERTNYFEELLKIFVPFLTFVLANYLVSSLMEGEGTFKAVFINTCGALVPIFIILPIMIILSNVLTYNEQFIYHFLLTIMMSWSAILLFFSIKDTHNYSVKETLFNFLLTILMMIVMIILFIMMYMMVMQVVEFVNDLVKEVIIRA